MTTLARSIWVELLLTPGIYEPIKRMSDMLEGLLQNSGLGSR